MAVKIQLETFWAVTPCNVVTEHQNFGGLCYLHLHTKHWYPHKITRCHNPEDLDTDLPCRENLKSHKEENVWVNDNFQCAAKRKFKKDIYNFRCQKLVLRLEIYDCYSQIPM